MGIIQKIGSGLKDAWIKFNARPFNADNSEWHYVGEGGEELPKWIPQSALYAAYGQTREIDYASMYQVRIVNSYYYVCEEKNGNRILIQIY